MPRMILSGAVSCLLALNAVSAREEGTPLPKAEQVRSITIEFEDSGQKTVKFKGTVDDWSAIRSKLLPAKRDDNPASWEGMGKIQIIKTDGKPFLVHLYTPSKGPGAFSAGASLKQRVYYRGGDTTALRKALEDAYDRFHKSSDENDSGISLQLSQVSAEHRSNDTIFRCQVAIDNDTKKDITVTSNFYSVFDGLELIVTNTDGKILKHTTVHVSSIAICSQRERVCPEPRQDNRNFGLSRFVAGDGRANARSSFDWDAPWFGGWTATVHGHNSSDGETGRDSPRRRRDPPRDGRTASSPSEGTSSRAMGVCFDQSQSVVRQFAERPTASLVSVLANDLALWPGMFIDVWPLDRIHCDALFRPCWWWIGKEHDGAPFCAAGLCEFAGGCL